MYNIIIGLECPIRISIKQFEHIPWIAVVAVVVVVIIAAGVIEVVKLLLTVILLSQRSF